MNILDDIKITLCSESLREQLILSERAKLLFELAGVVGHQEYEKFNNSGEYIGPDIEQAKQELLETQKRLDTDKKSLRKILS